MLLYIIEKIIIGIINTNHIESSTQKIEQTLLDMIVKDLQPPSIVEDDGFKQFVSILDPRSVNYYVKKLMIINVIAGLSLPSRQQAYYYEDTTSAKDQLISGVLTMHRATI